MDFLSPPLPFDPAKPFYPLVLAYIAQVHGLIELSSRGALHRLRSLPQEDVAAFVEAEQDPERTKQYERLLAGGVTALVGKQQLRGTQGPSISVNVESLSQTVLRDGNAAVAFVNRMSAGALLILAWETTMDWHSNDPLWEFLRHCRNAAAHKGYLRLLNGEPRRPANWRSAKITATLHGQVLFPDPPNPSFLDPGDVLHLLADVEARFL